MIQLGVIVGVELKNICGPGKSLELSEKYLRDFLEMPFQK